MPTELPLRKKFRIGNAYIGIDWFGTRQIWFTAWTPQHILYFGPPYVSFRHRLSDSLTEIESFDAKEQLKMVEAEICGKCGGTNFLNTLVCHCRCKGDNK